MVCLGNICRSPTAHGVFESMVRQRGLTEKIQVDSAGTSGWHIGEPPDSRSQSAASKRGYDLSEQRGRQVTELDFEHFNYILAMDQANLSELKRLQPEHYEGHLGLFLDFAGDVPAREVPDPYYGDGKGFDTVLDLVEVASDGLLTHILARNPF